MYNKFKFENSLHYHKIKNEGRVWLKKYRYDIFSTITLRKYVYNNEGALLFNNREWAEGTAKEFRNRLSRKLVGRRGRINILTTLEVSSLDNMLHLHVLFENKKNIALDDIKAIINNVVIDLDWVYEEIKTIPIEDKDTLVHYCTKMGFDSLVPSGCSVGH